MSDKVTQEQVDAYIADVQYTKLGKKTCVGLATLANGFEVCESSACVDGDNYDEDVGRSLVLHRIKDKVWMLLGFELQTNASFSPPESPPETQPNASPPQ